VTHKHVAARRWRQTGDSVTLAGVHSLSKYAGALEISFIKLDWTMNPFAPWEAAADTASTIAAAWSKNSARTEKREATCAGPSNFKRCGDSMQDKRVEAANDMIAALPCLEMATVNADRSTVHVSEANWGSAHNGNRTCKIERCQFAKN
jgi:hypothetical protein